MAEDSAEKEEKEMSEKKNLLSEVLEPVEDGAKMAGSSEAAELLVRTFHHALSKSKPAWAEILKRGGMDFHHVQAAILAAGVKVLVSVWPNLPKAATAKEIADLALRFESAMILKPLFGHVAEFIEALVSGGSSLLSGVRDASGSRKGTTMVRINVAE
jgi:hypothetical protein